MRKIEVGDRVRIIKIDYEGWKEKLGNGAEPYEECSEKYKQYLDKIGIVVQINTDRTVTVEFDSIQKVQEDNINWLCSEVEILNEDIEGFEDKQNQTLVVNLLAPPCRGKSTIACDVFARLKYKGIDCELVQEYHKDLVWEKREETFKDELYTFAKQNHRLFRVNGKVDVIIMDRPIILSAFYGAKYGDYKQSFVDVVIDEFSRYNNLNFYLEKGEFEYNPNGRNQTEEESDEIDLEMRKMLEKNLKMIPLKSNSDTAEIITNIVLERMSQC